GPELVGGARRRGVRPMKFERARDAMRSDILEGNLTPSELRDMLEKNLSEKYGVSRDTARKARDAVLSEWRQLNSRQSPTNDKYRQTKRFSIIPRFFGSCRQFGGPLARR